MNIGFFDSGLGGLTILKSTALLLQHYDYEFVGDTANLPYGDKTEEEIYELTKAGVAELFARNCVLVIIACNTASAQTLRRLQDEYLPSAYPGRKILGVIVPTVEAIISHGVTQVTLLATKRTVDSGKYSLELANRSHRPITLTSIATPELVPLIELGEIEAATNAAIAHLKRVRGECDGIILGCTHYTQIKDQLRAHVGPSIPVFSQDEIIPHKILMYLEQHPEIASQLTHGGKRSIHLTKHRPDYDAVMSQFLGGVYLR